MNSRVFIKIYRKFAGGGFPSYSQSGEDCIMHLVLNALNIESKSIRYLDLGANDPIYLSNTFAFYKRGAKGVLIEANPILAKKLKKTRKHDTVLNKAVALSSEMKEIDFYLLNKNTLSTASEKEVQNYCICDPEVKILQTIKIPAITINELIHEYFEGIAPTFISLDIEGLDYEILSCFDFDKYRPVGFIVETIEYNPNLSIPRKHKDIIALFEKNNYVEFAFTGINSIFVDALMLK